MKLITPKEAAIALEHGDIIAYPTEAVYGLGCDPFNEKAAKRLLKLKQRDDAKGFILIASNWQQVAHLVRKLSDDKLAKIFATWPGPVTWVFPASDTVPAWIRGEHETVAIRISAYPVVREICENFKGAIVSTSANLSGYSAPRTRKELAKQFAFSDDFIVVRGRVGKLNRPTPIYDAESGKVIRV